MRLHLSTVSLHFQHWKYWQFMSICQVSEAIQERAKRIYDKYGNVMLEVKGMTKAGVERKATCRALFSKLLYLAGELQSCRS
jgi:hypothetical protein